MIATGSCLCTRAGIAEVWIVDVAHDTLSAFRNPEGHVYRDEQVLIAQSLLLCSPDITVKLSGFFET